MHPRLSHPAPRFVLSAMLLLLLSSTVLTHVHAQIHADSGMVVRTNGKSLSILVSCAEIPGYMAPMEMWFKVRRAEDLKALKPGMPIRFNIVTSGPTLYAEQIKQEASQNFESEPMQAGGLTAIASALSSSEAAAIVKVGDPVPDFTLTDQSGEQIRLSQFKDKVVALTFGYSRCPNPNYCRRLSNNLAGVERRFASRAGRDLILLTIDIDPEHDRGETLSAYAQVWHADPSKWHFLSGATPDVRRVANLFGMDFWRDEGLLTHSLHTVIIDRQGHLAVNLEGNRFTTQQLGDLVKSQLEHDL
jgi:protein SCO1/2